MKRQKHVLSEYFILKRSYCHKGLVQIKGSPVLATDEGRRERGCLQDYLAIIGMCEAWELTPGTVFTRIGRNPGLGDQGRETTVAKTRIQTTRRSWRTKESDKKEQSRSSKDEF